MFQLRDCAFTLAFSTSGGSFAIEGFSVFSSGRNVGGGSFSFARYDVSTSTCSCNCFANCERSDMIYRQSLFEYVLDLKIILWVGHEEAGMLGPFISEGYRRALSLITPHQSHHFLFLSTFSCVNCLGRSCRGYDSFPGNPARQVLSWRLTNRFSKVYHDFG